MTKDELSNEIQLIAEKAVKSGFGSTIGCMLYVLLASMALNDENRLAMVVMKYSLETKDLVDKLDRPYFP